MAIKTKKITDLKDIVSDDLANNCYLIASVKSGVTGKVSYELIKNDIEDLIDSKIANTEVEVQTASLCEESSVSSEVIEALQQQNLQLKREISDVVTRYSELHDNYNNFVITSNSTILTLQTAISDISSNTEKLIEFIRDLQKDKYLTLAEIKKAAIKAFPVIEE